MYPSVYGRSRGGRTLPAPARNGSGIEVLVSSANVWISSKCNPDNPENCPHRASIGNPVLRPGAGGFRCAREHAPVAHGPGGGPIPGIRNTPALPSPSDNSRPVCRCLVRGWWRKAEGRAGLVRQRGRGWHSLMRKFATELMDEPLKVVCKLGGWKDAETVLNCLQRPDQDSLREALDRRGNARTGPESTVRIETKPLPGETITPLNLVRSSGAVTS